MHNYLSHSYKGEEKGGDVEEAEGKADRYPDEAVDSVSGVPMRLR